MKGKNPMHMINDYRLYESPTMTVAGKPYQVERNWRERLLSWPWRPLKATRTVVPQVPDPDVIVVGYLRNIYGHPQTIRAMVELAKTKPQSDVLENVQ